MLERQKLAPRAEQKREELFTERYERLLAWALRLTNQNRPSAEDLVQDAFIQFVLGRTASKRSRTLTVTSGACCVTCTWRG